MKCFVYLFVFFLTSSVWAQQKISPKKIAAGENFKTENLVCWCIVPFDAKNRGPAERAKMVRELGMRRVAYDWREKHIPEFEQEILEYKKNGIEYFAFWGWHKSMSSLIKKHKIAPQIWQIYNGKLDGGDQANLEKAVSQFAPIAKLANDHGLQFGIYNHGGWAGRPENLVAICKELRGQRGLENVGVVYNFHHGHGDIKNFKQAFEVVKPYLLCVNINGMTEEAKVNPKTHENKILPLGTGLHERRMIEIVIRSGYEGPIGVLGHRAEMDAKQAVGLNLQGLEAMVDTNGPKSK